VWRQVPRQHRLPVVCGHMHACIMIDIMVRHIMRALLLLL
jgi:hypothetical protein